MWRAVKRARMILRIVCERRRARISSARPWHRARRATAQTHCLVAHLHTIDRSACACRTHALLPRAERHTRLPRPRPRANAHSHARLPLSQPHPSRRHRRPQTRSPTPTPLHPARRLQPLLEWSRTEHKLAHRRARTPLAQATLPPSSTRRKQQRTTTTAISARSPQPAERVLPFVLIIPSPERGGEGRRRTTGYATGAALALFVLAAAGGRGGRLEHGGPRTGAFERALSAVTLAVAGEGEGGGSGDGRVG